MKKRYITSLNQIPQLAKALSGKLKGGEILALIGSLGSGKTAFTKHLAKFLKIKKTVSSPSFVLMNLFQTKTKKGKKITLYHLDLYRTRNFKEIRTLGITEFWGKPGTLTVIEWANKIKRHMPKKTTLIQFKN